jgi:hypothetical protein
VASGSFVVGIHSQGYRCLYLFIASVATHGEAPGRSTRSLRSCPASCPFKRRSEFHERGDNSLIGGLISAATLVGVNYVVGLATYKNKKLEAVIEGRPQVLIHNGRLFEDVMKGAKLTHHEVNAALRQSGCSCVEEVHLAFLENNGAISVVQRRANES